MMLPFPELNYEPQAYISDLESQIARANININDHHNQLRHKHNKRRHLKQKLKRLKSDISHGLNNVLTIRNINEQEVVIGTHKQSHDDQLSTYNLDLNRVRTVTYHYFTRTIHPTLG